MLKGAFIFAADLARATPISHAMDFLVLAGYGGDLGGRSRIRLIKDLDMPITGRDVLLVENVVDTGLTLNYVVKTLALRNPRDIAICTLLDRPYRRLVDDLPMRYVGFTVPDQFFVGYGFHLHERYRGLPTSTSPIAWRRPCGRQTGNVNELVAFLGVAVLVIVTPGPDTALTIRNTLLGGRPAGIATALGVVSGQAVWALATSVGLVALLLASEPAFAAVRIAGAAYLIYLGVQALVAAFRPGGNGGVAAEPRRHLPTGAAVRQG